MPLISLPTELLVDIFTYLTYFDITIALPATCQRLRTIATSITLEPPKSLRATLFREKFQRLQYSFCPDADLAAYDLEDLWADNDGFYIEPDIFEPNPCFGYLVLCQLNNRCSSNANPANDTSPPQISLNDIGFLGRSGQFTPLRTTIFANQNFTSPPIDNAIITLGHEFLFNNIQIDLRGTKKAVTVLDIVERIAEMSEFKLESMFEIDGEQVEHMVGTGTFGWDESKVQVVEEVKRLSKCLIWTKCIMKGPSRSFLRLEAHLDFTLQA